MLLLLFCTTGKFLSSVLLRCKAAAAIMLCCSPVPVVASPAAGGGGHGAALIAAQLSAAAAAAASSSSSSRSWKVHHHHPAVKEQGLLVELSVAPVALAAPGAAAEMLVDAAMRDNDARGNGGAGVEDTELEARKKKQAAVAARRRPSRLVIPALADAAAGEALLGEAMAAAAAAEKEEAAVEAEGDGFWVASRRGARHAMEDGYGIVTNKISGDSRLAFYGVYDGHGGRAAVDFVSGRLGNHVVTAAAAAAVVAKRRSQPPPASEEASTSPAADHVAAAIRAAYLATDSEFLGRQQQLEHQQQGTRGGACAATALVIDGDLYVANVGDCRAVMSRDGTATALSSDHTAAREDERTRIESSGGYVSCGSNGVWRVQDCLAVSRAFGDGGLKRWVVAEPEVSRTTLAAGCDFLVIASDGLWNKVSNQEAVDAVSAAGAGTAAGKHSVESCRQLVDMARRRGSRDDITVMVVDLKRFLHPCTGELIN